MAKTSGLGDNFYVGGYDLSGDVASVDSISKPMQTIDQTAINASAMERNSGQRDGAIEFTSFFNPSSSQEHEILSTTSTSDVHVMYLRGTTLGNAGAAEIAKQVSYDPTRGQDGSLTLKVSTQANGYGVEWGKQLTDGLRTDTAATEGSALDNGAGTTTGAEAYLQLTAFDGTDVTVLVEESTDNTTWSTLMSFTQVTAAPATERLAVTSTTDRYLRVTSTTSAGFNSCTFAVLVKRNNVAVSF